MGGRHTKISNKKARLRELTAQTDRGKDDIETKVIDCTNTKASTTVTCVHELTAQAASGKEDIESTEIDGTNTITSTTVAGVHELTAQTAKGKDDIESTVIDGTNTIASTTETGVRELTAQSARGKEDIESKVVDGNNTFASKTETGVHELTAQTARGKKDIESVIIEGRNTLASTTVAGVHELTVQTARGKDDTESVIIDGSNTLASTTVAGVHELTAHTARGKDDIESVIIDGMNTIASTTEAVVHELTAQTARGKEEIESKVIDGTYTITSTTVAGVHELTAQKARGKDDIESVIIEGRGVIQSDLKAVKEEIVVQVDVAKREIRDVKTNADEDNYSQSKEKLLSMMMKHYNRKLSHVPTSALKDEDQYRLLDIYMPPNLHLMVKDKANGSFKTTGTAITKYSDVFLKDGKNNRNMFIQGEAGSGKSTFLAKLVMDWCRIKTPQLVERIQAYRTDAGIEPIEFFKDCTTLEEYSFVFHVTLRQSVKEYEISEMIKKQIIKSIYDKEDRKNAKKLLNEIMKRERCLVQLDGLDEWTGPAGHNLPELAESHSQCDVLITTRPWKFTEAKIPDQKMSTLLQREGVNEPFEVSKRLLGCREDCKDNEDLDKKQSEFEAYIFNNDLEQFLISPMLLQLIVHSWAEGTEIKGSKCEIYSLFLESLLKKANRKTRKFESPPFRCFTGTEYIRPNIENVDRLAEAAFHLLFSNTRESSLVFCSTDLERFKLDEGEHNEFALKSGILSATRKASKLRSSSSFSFIHKSVQEFLAAVYIANDTHPIDDIVSAYLNRYKEAYLEISQVFIFLCGLKISAANKLSSMMNERDVDKSFHVEFSEIILSGYREAVANKHSDSNLKLSHFHFVQSASELRDIPNILKNNMSNVLSFVLIGLDRGESASHYEFDLSTCSKLQNIIFRGTGIWLKDYACSSISELPVWVVLNSTDALSVLPCITDITFYEVTCSSTCLHSLLSTLMILDHEVRCALEFCRITSCVEESDTFVCMTVLNNTLKM